MLQALRPEVPTFDGPFERWVREQGPAYGGHFLFYKRMERGRFRWPGLDADRGTISPAA